MPKSLKEICASLWASLENGGDDFVKLPRGLYIAASRGSRSAVVSTWRIGTSGPSDTEKRIVRACFPVPDDPRLEDFQWKNRDGELHVGTRWSWDMPLTLLPPEE